MTKSLEALKPGKYAILYRDNWDGEGDVYHTLANLEADGRWLSDETGKELLEYEGDEILKSWPLDDGFDTIGLIAALEEGERRIAELEARKLSFKLPDPSSKLFWGGIGKNETFYPSTYKIWVADTIERAGTIAGIKVEVK